MPTAEEKVQLARRLEVIEELIYSQRYVDFAMGQINMSWVKNPRELMMFAGSYDWSEEPDASPIRELMMMVFAELVTIGLLYNISDPTDEAFMGTIRVNADYRRKELNDPTLTIVWELLEGMREFRAGRLEGAEQHLKSFEDLTKEFHQPWDEQYLSEMKKHLRSSDTAGVEHAFEQRALTGFVVQYNEIAKAIERKIARMKEMSA